MTPKEVEEAIRKILLKIADMADDYGVGDESAEPMIAADFAIIYGEGNLATIIRRMAENVDEWFWFLEEVNDDNRNDRQT